MAKVLIIIPAHNEAPNLNRVIDEARQRCPFADILIVNDASQDITEEIARIRQVRIINIPFQLGIGGAMQTGFILAQGNNYDIVVQVDGDGQHDPSQIKDLIDPILKSEADVVIGSRFLGKIGYRTDFLHRLGILILSKLLYFVTKERVTDPTSGFRAANRRTLNFYAENYPVDYPEAEAIVLLSQNNFKIKEIPVTMRPRLSGKSSIRGLHIIYYMIEVMLAIFISAISGKARKEE